MRLLVATTNAGKLREIGPMLDGIGVELATLAAFPPIDAPDETGTTFSANARLKALYYAAATGEITVAEDSGLEIDALGGAPGIESARYGGADSTYVRKFELIYGALAERKTSAFADATADPADRAARFVCALALVKGNDVLFEARGTIEGLIAAEPMGEGGFGYDPIFFYPPFGCTLAEAGPRKAEVSHRGEAFRRLREFLQSRGARF